MDADKLRNLTDAEMQHQQRELNDQLFRLKFQLKMGQTESLKKIRGLRKDVARIKTLVREKQLGVTHAHHAVAKASPAAAAETAPAVAASAKTKAKAAAKSASKSKAAKPAAKARKK
ncbi:MAG: 50S ribosomal protein L29 [Acidobacteriia bacterium]|nr:50S ribosomal protein L29 [Terriglobia bacterium]